MQQLLIGFVAFSLLSSSTLDWWQIVLMCMGGAGSVIYALYTYQENLLFQPVIMNFHSPEQNPPGYRSPAERKMAFEEVNFDAEDGEKLTGWFIPAKEVSDVEQGEAVTILYFHANAGSKPISSWYSETWDSDSLFSKSFITSHPVTSSSSPIVDMEGYHESVVDVCQNE
eukprot:139666-Amorphochlora_amoeboformis.AAC.3